MYYEQAMKEDLSKFRSDRNEMLLLRARKEERERRKKYTLCANEQCQKIMKEEGEKKEKGEKKGICSLCEAKLHKPQKLCLFCSRLSGKCLICGEKKKVS